MLIKLLQMRICANKYCVYKGVEQPLENFNYHYYTGGRYSIDRYCKLCHILDKQSWLEKHIIPIETIPKGPLIRMNIGAANMVENPYRTNIISEQIQRMVHIASTLLPGDILVTECGRICELSECDFSSIFLYYGRLCVDCRILALEGK